MSLTLAGDHTFCFYPKIPLTFSHFLKIPVNLQPSFSLRMANVTDARGYSAAELHYLRKSSFRLRFQSGNFVNQGQMEDTSLKILASALKKRVIFKQTTVDDNPAGIR